MRIAIIVLLVIRSILVTAMAQHDLRDAGFLSNLNAASSSDPVVSSAPDAWWRFDQITNSAGSSVSYVPDSSGNFRFLYATNNFPTATNGGVHFNGSSTFFWIANDRWPTPSNQPPTGVCYDSRYGDIWMANFLNGFFVRVNRSGQQMEVVTNAIGTNTLQGLAVDVSNGDFYAVGHTEETIYRLNSNGVIQASTNLTGIYSVNGLALSGTNLWLCTDASGEIRNYSTTFVSNFVITASLTNADHITVNTNGTLLVSGDGPGFGSSEVNMIDPSTGATIASYQLSWLDAIEGIAVMPNGEWYIGVDDGFHVVAQRQNYIARVLPSGLPNDMSCNVGGVTLINRVFPRSITSTRVTTVFTTPTQTLNRSAQIGGSTSGRFSTSGRRTDADSSQTINGSIAIGTTSNIVCASVFDYSAGAAYQYTAGALDVSTLSFQTAGLTSATESFSSRVGSGGNGGVIWAGSMAEGLVYSRAVSSNSIVSITQTLNSR